MHRPGAAVPGVRPLQDLPVLRRTRPLDCPVLTLQHITLTVPLITQSIACRNKRLSRLLDAALGKVQKGSRAAARFDALIPTHAADASVRTFSLFHATLPVWPRATVRDWPTISMAIRSPGEGEGGVGFRNGLTYLGGPSIFIRADGCSRTDSQMAGELRLSLR